MEKWSEKWPDGLNLILGLWLLIAPFIGFGDALPAAAWNSWIIGAIVAAVAAIGLSQLSPWAEWVNLVAGAWIFLAPFMFAYGGVDEAAWTHILTGGAIATIAAIGVARRRHPRPAEPA